MSAPLDTPRERLYFLLPALYRARDLAHGQPLRALLALIEDDLRALEGEVDDLYRNWFIETCEDWAIPYLGDLLGVRGLEDDTGVVAGRRARVADALALRRRKGTIAAIERLAHDVTGWHARAVELFERLATTPHARHARRGKGAALDVRRSPDGRAPGAAQGGAFDPLARTPDVRRVPAGGAARPNVPNLALFMWRVQAYPIRRSAAHFLPDKVVLKPFTPPKPAGGAPAASVQAGIYAVSPIGRGVRLFNNPQSRAAASGAADETHLPMPIPPAAFAANLDEYRERYADATVRPAGSAYYGPGRALNLVRVDARPDGSEERVPIPPFVVVGQDLPTPSSRAPEGRVAVDVIRGRVAFAAADTPPLRVEVDYHYGFTADLGGGPYDRRATLAAPRPGTWQATVSKAGEVKTLQQALDVWSALPESQRLNGIIWIADHGAYGGQVSIDLRGAPRRLAVQAVDGVRPSLSLIGSLDVIGDDPDSRLTLNGLLIDGSVQLRGSLHLDLVHATVAPGHGVQADAGDGAPGAFDVRVRHSLIGRVRLPGAASRLTVEDSVVDAGGAAAAVAADDAGAPGAPASFERATVFGSVAVQQLTLASESIFTRPVTAEDVTVGCVRYSFLPAGSRTAARFRCQPDLALVACSQELALEPGQALPPAERDLVQARLAPRFTSEAWGDAGYAQLAAACAEEIRTGAEGGAEMGVFRHLRQPQRAIGLRRALDQELRLGLEAQVIYVT